jgi:(4S)-4-hydroxy-5-phosphonooxypentane-2,3-dione isomerase
MSQERADRETRPRWRLAAALCLAAAGLWALAGAPPAAAAAEQSGVAAVAAESSGIAAVAALSAASSSEAAPAEIADGSPVCVAVIYVVQPGREEEAAEDLRRLAAVTRKEPGNLLYAVHRSLDDPRQFMIYEQYRSQADLDAHRKTPYYQRYSVEGLQKIAESRTGGTFTPF